MGIQDGGWRLQQPVSEVGSMMRGSVAASLTAVAARQAGESFFSHGLCLLRIYSILLEDHIIRALSTWFKRPPNWSTRTDLTDCTNVTTADQKRSARAQISVECGLGIGPTLCGLVQKWFRFCFTNLIYIKFRIIDKFEMERIIFPLSLVPISHIFQLNLIVRKYWLINNRTKFSYKISCS